MLRLQACILLGSGDPTHVLVLARFYRLSYLFSYPLSSSWTTLSLPAPSTYPLLPFSANFRVMSSMLSSMKDAQPYTPSSPRNQDTSTKPRLYKATAQEGQSFIFSFYVMNPLPQVTESLRKEIMHCLMFYNQGHRTSSLPPSS